MFNNLVSMSNIALICFFRKPACYFSMRKAGLSLIMAVMSSKKWRLSTNNAIMSFYSNKFVLSYLD